MFFGLDAHGRQQVKGALGVRRIVARWGVGGNFDELLQKAHLLIKVRVNPGIKFSVSGHGVERLLFGL